MSELLDYYERFINLCCSDLYNKCIEAAKKNRTRINMLIFDLSDKFDSEVPYCSILQGTHKTENSQALFNKWVINYKLSSLNPVINEIKKRLQTDLRGYKINVYKFWYKKWAIELEWLADYNHDQKIKNYLEKYGSPY